MFLLAQATSPSAHDVLSLMDRYGLPLAMLVAFVWFVYKVLWPFMTKEVEGYREITKAQLAEGRADMRTQAAKAEAQAAAFLAALASRDDLLRVEFERLHDRLDRYRDNRNLK